MLTNKQWEARKKLIEKEKADVERDKVKREMLSERLLKEFGCTYEGIPEVKTTLTEKKEKLEKQLEGIEKELNGYDW